MKFTLPILVCSFCLICRVANAQPDKAKQRLAEVQKTFDSLKQLLPGSPDDSIKVHRLSLISGLQEYNGVIKTEFAQQALLLAEKLNYKEGILLAYKDLANVYQLNKDYQKAIIILKKAIALPETTGNKSDNTAIYSTLLNLYFYLGDYPNAMETISREMLLAEKNKDKKRIAHCDNILGYIFFKQENFEASIASYNRYINLASALNDSLMLAHALGELSDVYTGEKKYRQAVDVLFRVINLCDRLEANTGKYNKEFVTGWTHQYRSKAQYRLSKNYKLTGEIKLAEKYALEAVEHTKNFSTSKYEIAAWYINAGDIFYSEKEFTEAINYLRYGYNLSREIQHRENARDAAEYLAQTYTSLNQYDSAFYFYQIYTGLKDSIVNNETKMKIAGIQGQYDVAKKDKEIARQQQIRNILIASFIFLLIVLLLLYNSYRLKQKNKYQHAINRQQNELFNAIVTTQDMERKRIAQDIHDSLGSVLSAAKLKLSSLEESKMILSAGQLENYQDSLALLDEASTELRNISHNIMPATLSKLGLEAALQNLIGKIATHSNIQINFTTHGLENRIEENTEMSIYRIVLELINNIVKHAAAKKVTLQLIKYPTYINLVIEDNGVGFNFEKIIEEKKGIGMGNIFSRVDYLKGTVEIDSLPGKGTTVIIEIPYDA